MTLHLGQGERRVPFSRYRAISTFFKKEPNYPLVAAFRSTM
jgi:hypothetical protein